MADNKRQVTVERISQVDAHPKADRPMVYTVGDHKVISSNLEDGSPRYKIGDLVVYCPPDVIVPEYILKDGWWDSENNKGVLGGENGDIVTATKIRKVLSEGIMFPVKKHTVVAPSGNADINYCATNERGDYMLVYEGSIVTEFLGFKSPSVED